MNAIDLLIQDHRRVEMLFTDFLAADSSDQQEELFQSLQSEILAHTEAEETVLYPALKPHAPDQIEKSLREHAEVKQIIAEMLNSNFEDERFDAQFSQMMETIQNHVADEEGPGGAMELAREKLGESVLARMGRQIRTIKQRMQGDLAA